jgi:hypothetical protein
MKKLYFLLPLLLIILSFPLLVSASTIIPSGPIYVENITSSYSAGKVTISLNGYLSIYREGNMTCEQTADPNESTIYSYPTAPATSATAVITSQSTALAGQSFPSSSFTYVQGTFGDCFSQATQTSFSTTYSFNLSTPGNHTLYIKVTDNAGQTVTVPTSFSIPYPALSATCEGTPQNPVINEAVTWKVSSVSGGSGAYSYSWVLNGGNPSSGTGSSVSTAYGTQGEKTAQLTVKSPNVSDITVSCKINVWKLDSPEPPDPTPSVWLTANPYSLTCGNGTTLAWEALNVTSCSATGSWSGSKQVGLLAGEGVYPPAETGEYRYGLDCTGNYGSVSTEVTVTVSCGLETPPTADVWFTANPIDYGYQNAVEWSSTKATTCIGTNFNTRNETSGSWLFKATTNNFSVRVDCDGPGGTAYDIDKLVVRPPATIVISSNLPTTWYLSGPTPRTQSTNSTGVTYTHQIIGNYSLLSVPDKLGYTKKIIPASSQYGASGETIYFSIIYTAVAVSADISASPNPITYNTSSNLTWSCTNANSATVKRSNGTVFSTNLSGSSVSTGSLIKTETYTLNCSNTDNGQSAYKEVTVGVGPLAKIWLDGNNLKQGETTNLNWECLNAINCTGTGFSTGGAHSGSLPITAVNSQTYSVTATNPHGASTASTTLTVQNLPDLTADAPTPSSAAVGTAVTFTATIRNIGNASTVNSFNNLFQVATGPNGTGTVSVISVNQRAALAAGANGPATSSPYTFSSAGTYSVRVCADNNATWTGTITESREDNNCSTSWTNVTVTSSLACSPSTQNRTIGEIANFTVVGGTGSYSWNAVGGSPTSGSGASFATSYNTTGTKNVSVTSGSETKNCSVVVSDAPPATPTGLQALPGACDTGRINVSWNASTGATSYQLRDGSTIIYNGANLSFPHTGLVASSTHSYTVRATNSVGSSAYSATVVVVAPGACPADPLVCAPLSQNKLVGETANLTASGGIGSYSWTASEGNPNSGTGSGFATSYSTVGTKTVTVTSGAQNKNCTVVVSEASTATAKINVISNISTSWTITGGNPPNMLSGAGTSRTYENQYPGIYIASFGAIEGYTLTIKPSNSQSVSENGTITFEAEYKAGGGDDNGGGGGFACIPSSQPGSVGQPINFQAVNGSSSYSWSAPGGNPSTGSGALFNTTYSTTGLKSVTVTSGGVDRSCAVNITEASPDFTIAKSRDIKAVFPGTSEQTTITVNPLGGFTGTVTFTVSSAHPALSGMTYTFNPTSVTSSQYSSGSAFQITMTTSVPAGTYPVIVTGTSAGISRDVTVNVQVGGGTGGVPPFEEF